jgi:tRNA (adenine37-N6)-methyltransferase
MWVTGMANATRAASAEPRLPIGDRMPQGAEGFGSSRAVRSVVVESDGANEVVSYRPIGVVRSPFSAVEGMPLQSVAAADVRAQVEVRAELEPGLRDLDGFSHLHLITHLHRGGPGGLEVVPFLDDSVRGIFATRSPRHPNPLGLSVVRLLGVTGPVLEICGVDLLDGTPVLDIKPYVPAFDAVAAERTGWLASAAERVHEVRADRRCDVSG